MQEYSIAVIGAGPAGMMAAISVSRITDGVILLEKNPSLGKKLLLSGKGRCNLTNIADLGDFLAHFGPTAQFLRSAFLEFFNTGLMRFFEEAGLKLKVERGGRVFPLNDESKSVLAVLKRKLEELKISLLYNAAAKELKKLDGGWVIELSDSRFIKARKVILATGGSSYALTGSTGDGFKIAEKLGHKIISLRPGLVPLEVKESWVRNLAGLSLKNIRVSFTKGKKSIASDVGEMIFTHYGVSGPLILELSSKIVDWFSDDAAVILQIDLKPGLSEMQLNNRLIRDFEDFGSRYFKNVLKELLPQKLIEVCIRNTGIPELKKVNQITAAERKVLVEFLKGLSLTVVGARPLEEAIVTQGGVSTREINPKTMESRLHKGLYFCGEIIDVAGDTGGYNLQAAFSTGLVAGKSAAQSLN